MPRRCRGQYDPLRIFVGGIPTDIGNGTQDLKLQIFTKVIKCTPKCYENERIELVLPNLTFQNRNRCA